MFFRYITPKKKESPNIHQILLLLKSTDIQQHSEPPLKNVGRFNSQPSSLASLYKSILRCFTSVGALISFLGEISGAILPISQTESLFLEKKTFSHVSPGKENICELIRQCDCTLDISVTESFELDLKSCLEVVMLHRLVLLFFC